MLSKTILACALCAATLLSGCSSFAPVSTPVEVKIPIAVACKAEEPAEPQIKCYVENADIFWLSKCMIYDIKTRKAYETELRAALNSCK